MHICVVVECLCVTPATERRSAECRRGLRQDGGGESALETNWEGPAVREPAAVEVVELQQEN